MMQRNRNRKCLQGWEFSDIISRFMCQLNLKQLSILHQNVTFCSSKINQSNLKKKKKERGSKCIIFEIALQAVFRPESHIYKVTFAQIENTLDKLVIIFSTEPFSFYLFFFFNHPQGSIKTQRHSLWCSWVPFLLLFFLISLLIIPPLSLREYTKGQAKSGQAAIKSHHVWCVSWVIVRADRCPVKPC